MMMRIAMLMLCLATAISFAQADQTDTSPATPNAEIPVPHPHARLATSLGDVEIELFPEKAPITVANFLKYLDRGTYDGTVFHRVIAGFVVQGGGYARDLSSKAVDGPIQNEAGNGLSNLRGTVAMARQDEPDSATSQFFVNLVDNTALDRHDDSNQGRGYAVFGRVVSGMDVIDQIAQKPTINLGMFQGLPAAPILIQHASRVAGTQEPANSAKE